MRPRRRGALTYVKPRRLRRPQYPCLAPALVPMRVRRFRLQRASEEEARGLRQMLDRESRGFGTYVELASARELLVPAG